MRKAIAFSLGWACLGLVVALLNPWLGLASDGVQGPVNFFAIVATLAFADQIALYEWLGAGTGDLRIISVTAAPLAAHVARGAFLEGLFHRLGAIQFDLVTGRCSA
jgi:hypothetical protein